MTVRLRYLAGTLGIEGLEPSDDRLPAACRWDRRTACHRAPALAYAEVVLALRRAGVPYNDEARRYGVLEEGARARFAPRPYQAEALDAWRRQRGRGLVVLPTGAGKTHVAVMAIDDRRRDTLVVAPTLDLVRQWFDVLSTSFDGPIGVLGGGEHDVRPLTVATYDSAHLHIEHLGARFGLLVFDECHHLPGPAYQHIARMSLAPFRLGLTATPERVDGKERVLNEGVDLPDANLAIVVSGTGSVREHVQRLGRILRPREGKRAVLYELVTAGTGETFTSERRREHVAYR